MLEALLVIIICMLVIIINFAHQANANIKILKKQIDSDNDLILTRIDELKKKDK
jgi:hypothetical protein